MRSIASLLSCALLTAAASAGPPSLTVRATDAATGKLLDGVKCGLVDKNGDVYARNFSGAPGKQPRAGDVLYVYRRGYDLAKVTLDGKTHIVRVALTAHTRRSTVRVKGAGPKTAWWMQVVVEAEGPGKEKPVKDSYRVDVLGAAQEVHYGAGTRCGVYVFGIEGLVWPMTRHLRPGRESVVHWESQRVVPVRGNLHTASFHVDMLWTPPGPPQRVDAWRWHMKAPWWLSDQLFDKGRKLRIVPDIPFHIFLREESGPFYRYVSPKDNAIELSGPATTRRIEEVPTVDGRTLVPGTILAPGRLDILSIVNLSHNPGLRGGCWVRVPKLWKPITLAAARWLTAWHVNTGLTHFRWVGAGRPMARSYPGRIVVTAPPGKILGWIGVYNVWRGSGRVRSGPSGATIGKRVKDVTEVQFHGLPPGRYGVILDLVVGNVRMERMAEATIPEKTHVGRLVISAAK